jgi:hypothetical protein
MRRVLSHRVASAVLLCSTLVVAVAGVVGTAATAGANQSAPVAGGSVQASSVSAVAARSGLATGPEILWESDADQNADYAAVAASGATWTTIDFDWNHIQSDGRDSWRWNAATDRAVLAARAHGLKIIAVAGYAPEWARRSDCPRGELHCFPQNASDYGRFLGAAAARYGSLSPDSRLRGTVTVWSLWNEPNHEPFSMPKPDPDKYAAMVKSAYVAVKAVDPSATVLTGGTAPAPDAPDGSDYQPATWLSGLYARGAGGFFDGVAHHPYSYPTNPLDAHDWNAYTQTKYLHDIMAAHGDGAKKVWGTEAGAPTGTAPRTVTEAQQAQWVRDYFTGWNTTFKDFTGPLVLFRLRDSSNDLSNLSDNFGLMHLDRSPKPAYQAFRDAMGGVMAWGGWGQLSASRGSAPTVSSRGADSLDLFVTDPSGSIVRTSWNGKSWSSDDVLPQPATVTLTRAPAAVSWGPNRIDVFSTGSDGAVWHIANDGSGWGGWESLGGRLTSAPAVAAWAPNRLDVFGRSTSGSLVHAWWNGTAWSGWESLGGAVVGAPAAVSWSTNRIDVFVRGTDNGMWHRWWDGARWQGYEALGGALSAGPTVASWAPGRLDVFVRGTDRAMWHRWFDGTRWQGYESLGGSLSARPSAASDARNHIDVFSRGAGSSVSHLAFG